MILCSVYSLLVADRRRLSDHASAITTPIVNCASEPANEKLSGESMKDGTGDRFIRETIGVGQKEPSASSHTERTSIRKTLMAILLLILLFASNVFRSLSLY